MPITKVSQAPNREFYESISAKLNLQGDRPAGLILHVAGETEAGTVQIIDVWESHTAAEQFERDRLLPMFETAGIMERISGGPHPITAETFEFEYPV
jgi:hypothetical protein